MIQNSIDARGSDIAVYFYIPNPKVPDSMREETFVRALINKTLPDPRQRGYCPIGLVVGD